MPLLLDVSRDYGRDFYRHHVATARQPAEILLGSMAGQNRWRSPGCDYRAPSLLRRLLGRSSRTGGPLDSCFSRALVEERCQILWGVVVPTLQRAKKTF